MKRERRFLTFAFGWCAAKCRALLGAFGFMLPKAPASAPVRWRSFRHAALLLVFLFLLLAPTFVRPRQSGAGQVFACPVIFRPYCYAASFGPTDFTYTGSYTWVQEAGTNFRLKFLTSGVFTPKKSLSIDVFLVGGGGGGCGALQNSYEGSGGGGGYTGTHVSYTLNANQAYTVVIGGGGAGVARRRVGRTGAAQPGSRTRWAEGSAPQRQKRAATAALAAAVVSRAGVQTVGTGCI